jgi:crossover junction endodeoxyribonuclease RusA
VTEHVELTLPLAPSVNHYWRRHGHTIYISSEGKKFRVDTQAAVLSQIGLCKPLTGRLAVSITIHPRDRRKIDLDNRLKAGLDALAHAGVYEDDSQIDRLTIERGELDRPNGSMRVVISEALTAGGGS